MVNQKNGIFSKLTGFTYTLFKLKLENINQEIDENASSLEKAILYGSSNLKCRKIIFMKDLIKLLMNINYDNFKKHIYPLILKLSNDNLEIKNEICNKIGDLCAYLLQNNNDNDGCTDILKLLFPIIEKFIKSNENKDILGNAMKSLLILSTHINSKSRRKVIFPYILSLIANDKYKHIGFILLIKICHIFDRDIIFTFLIPYMESFLKKKDLSSRIFISFHLYNICKMMNEEDLSRIFIIFKKLCNDENDIIKIINIYNCAHISSLYSKTIFFYFFVPLYNNFLRNCNLYIFYYSLINLFFFICNFEDINLIHPFYIHKMIFFFNNVFSSHLFTLNYLNEMAKKQSNCFFLNIPEIQNNSLKLKINENQEYKIETVNNFDEKEVSNHDFSYISSNETCESNPLYYTADYGIPLKSEDTSLKLGKIKEISNNYEKGQLSNNLKNIMHENDQTEENIYNENNNSMKTDKIREEDISAIKKSKGKNDQSNLTEEEQHMKTNTTASKNLRVELNTICSNKEINEVKFEENINEKNKMEIQGIQQMNSREIEKRNSISNLKENYQMKSIDEYSTKILSNDEITLKEYKKKCEIKPEIGIGEGENEKKNDEDIEDEVAYKLDDTTASTPYGNFNSSSQENVLYNEKVNNVNEDLNNVNEKKNYEVLSPSFFFNNSLINDLIINNNHFCFSIKFLFEIYDNNNNNNCNNNNNYTFKKIDKKIDNMKKGNSKSYFSYLNEKELKIIDNAFNHNMGIDLSLIKGCYYNELELIKKNTVYTKVFLKKENKNKSKNNDNIDDEDDIYNIGDIDIDLIKKKYIFDSSNNIIESHNINAVYITTLYIPTLILVFKQYFFRFFSHVFFFICTYPYYFIRKTVASLFYDILQNFLKSDFLIISNEKLNHKHENMDKFLKKRKSSDKKKFISTLAHSLKAENKSNIKINNKGKEEQEITEKMQTSNNDCKKCSDIDYIEFTKSIDKHKSHINIENIDKKGSKENKNRKNNQMNIKKGNIENIELMEKEDIKDEKKNDSDNNKEETKHEKEYGFREQREEKKEKKEEMEEKEYGKKDEEIIDEKKGKNENKDEEKEKEDEREDEENIEEQERGNGNKKGEKEKEEEEKEDEIEKENNEEENKNIEGRITMKYKKKENKCTKMNNYKNTIKKIQNQINTNLYESDFFINEENENFFFYKKFLHIYENIYIKFIEKFKKYYNEDSPLFFFHFFIYYFLKDSNVLVKKAILKNYDKIIALFPNKTQKILISYLFNVLEYKTINYSLRKRISKIIFKIVLKTDDATIIRKYLFPIFVKLCKDDVALIRTYTSSYFYLFLKKGCPNIYNFFKGNGKILPLEEYHKDIIIQNEDNFKLRSNYFISGDEISLIKKIIITFAKSKHFYDRQIFIKMCEGIINECPINLFLLYFLNPFLNLSEDKIQVVRITWEKCISSQIRKKGVLSNITNVLEKLNGLYEKYEKAEKSKINSLINFNDSNNFSVKTFNLYDLDN